MKRITTTGMGLLVLLLGTPGSAWGQGTIRVTFDGFPERAPGSTTLFSFLSESGVGVHSLGGNSTMRWSGDPLFPDNGSAYIQPRGSTDLFFSYGGSGWRFDAVSVDLALYSASSLDPVTIQFVASGYTRTIDIIATTEFTITGAVDDQGRPLFQTFYFPPEFQGMYYLSVTPTAPLWSLDNLVISPIPEPSAWALLGCGAVLLVGHWLRRLRRRE
ncbi:MAG: hypothetical protein KIS67_16610 [Verrucomicrobiae bacterium]|nr:hypothetical protein [Verrucomicrobiae bacterium]